MKLICIEEPAVDPDIDRATQSILFDEGPQTRAAGHRADHLVDRLSLPDDGRYRAFIDALPIIAHGNAEQLLRLN